ncbi:hypothetical protein [Amycolatopsis cihanbeyliensis]|uniref:Secreted protein n=1 Tax=Amycolatopsis cihanbeyliensis TaxID=1128664 RepID=A0A542DK14_AMYCI|nr:hypothetical protein [Amycolatopsis cihanbeyliensis]TQJ03438.1 hypothetical protein FB471_3198 [Amycolatopsis cihanbeyliensis]
MTSTATRAAGEHGAQAAGTAGPGGNGAPAQPRSGLAGLAELPAGAARRIVRATRRTPGRLSLIAVGLVVLALLTGVFGTIAMQDRKGAIDGLVEHREPLAAAAQEVFRSLSDADATAASSFLFTGGEPRQLRERYELDIAKAGAALAKAASDSAGVGDAATQVDILSQQLPVYTGLVEQARANNLQGFPVGASYLREASHLMRSTLLPAAEELYQIDTQRLAEEQDDASGFPWLTALLVLALLGALIAAQVYLKRITNRVFNIGLVVATIAVGVAVLWTAAALIVQSVLVSAGRDSTEQMDQLVQARITALKARADETLTLVARGGGEEYEKEFVQLTAELAGPEGEGGMLGRAKNLTAGEPAAESAAAAANDATAWLRAHTEVRSLDRSGDHDRAVELALDGADEQSAAAAFSRLDGHLAEAINAARQGFLDDTTNGSRALILLAPGFAVLAVLAALGVTMGIRERLREYR